ncbi:MAG: hypothetical protein WC695_11555 [Candidatus Omnitrophota bacterium]
MIKLRKSFFLIVPGIVFLSNVYAQEVLVTTDKTVYARSEKIKVVISNQREDAIFSLAATAAPEQAISNFEKKRTAFTWDAYPTRCRGLGCKDDVLEPKKIAAGEVLSFLWKPSIYMKKPSPVPEPGEYRLTIIFQVRKNAGLSGIIWNTAKSNEFILQ